MNNFSMSPTEISKISVARSGFAEAERCEPKRPRRYQDREPPIRLQRQSLFQKPVKNA